MTDHPSPSTDPRGWVSLYGDALFRFAITRVRSASLAEDLVQETFLAALRARESFAGKSSELTWLTGILLRKIVDQYRRAQAQSRGGGSIDEQQESAFDKRGHWRIAPHQWAGQNDDAVSREDFRRVLDECLSKLPPTLGPAFLLREIEQLETEEICKILGITTTNLWARLYRSRMAIRDCLERNWFADRAGQ